MLSILGVRVSSLFHSPFANPSLRFFCFRLFVSRHLFLTLTFTVCFIPHIPALMPFDLKPQLASVLLLLFFFSVFPSALPFLFARLFGSLFPHHSASPLSFLSLTPSPFRSPSLSLPAFPLHLSSILLVYGVPCPLIPSPIPHPPSSSLCSYQRQSRGVPWPC